MIEINLLPGKKKKAAGGGAGFKLALPDFRGLLASIKNPWLLAASAASLIVVGGGLLWFITQSTRLNFAQTRRFDVQSGKSHPQPRARSEEHASGLQSNSDVV